jgi:hypothetical protein
MERWRAECLRALAQAKPDGSDDYLVALIVGAYFESLHYALGLVTDPQAQGRLCEEEAAHFLAILRGVPAARQEMKDAKIDKQRRAGLLVFPEPPGTGERSRPPWRTRASIVGVRCSATRSKYKGPPPVLRLARSSEAYVCIPLRIAGSHT